MIKPCEQQKEDQVDENWHRMTNLWFRKRLEITFKSNGPFLKESFQILLNCILDRLAVLRQSCWADCAKGWKVQEFSFKVLEILLFLEFAIFTAFLGWMSSENVKNSKQLKQELVLVAPIFFVCRLLLQSITFVLKKLKICWFLLEFQMNLCSKL